MKTCFKCLRILPMDAFYAHPSMADGHLGKCKDCARRDVGKNRMKRRAHYVAYDKARHAGDRRDRRNESASRWNREHKLETSAHREVERAVRDGRLERKPCRFCASTKTIAHHEDYTKPLDVWWLCQACHFSVHAAKRGQTPWRLIHLGAA